MNTTSRARTEVEHLTLHYQEPPEASSTDATILRLRVERLLDTVDLQPAGLPSGAIFIVRKLEQPAPLPLASSSYSLPRTWKEGMREQMDALYAHAARPAHGPISPGANSVLFTDASEMLACLTRDLLVGEAWQRWYWQAFLRNVPRSPGPALATLWSKQASAIPTVLASLKVTEATAALTQLSPGELYTVTCALHASFELPSEPLAVLRQIAQARPRDKQPFDGSSSLTLREAVASSEILPGSDSQSDVSPESPLYTAAVPPWWRWLDSAATASLTPQEQYLLGLGLSLHHAPTFARSEKFAQQAISWLRMPSMEQAITEDQVKTVTRPSRPLSRQIAPNTDPVRDTAPAAFSLEGLRELEGAHESPADAASAPSFTAAAGEAASSSSASPASLPAPVPDTQAPSGEDRQERVDSEGRKNKASLPRKFTFGASRELPEDGVATELGGILYLIHLLTWLHLPAGWDEDGAFAEGLSGWATLEALARALLGTWHDSYADDSIWSMLALLDQRAPGTPLGMEMAQQSAFRLPPRWLLLHRVSEPAWVALVNGSRMLLCDEEDGYPIVDVPLSGRTSEEAILAELETYQSAGILPQWHRDTWLWDSHLHSDMLPYVSEPVAWWLERVQGFMRAFLLRRLNSPEFDKEQFAIKLLNRPGRLIASRTHIDLYMSMEQISLPIRLAGLDRDPSWIPDLGRIVLFHFL